ncbi:MAG: ketoacyl-ACP synthase III [Deltaproteobacteria bacterium]|nr:ketoacyl-ACP synthase III [Deltaproteobacteria bacterium]
MPNSIITGTGSYIPELKIENSFFINNEFYSSDRQKVAKPNKDIIATFQDITCIKERRWVTDDLNTSDIACLAAKEALNGMSGEDLDFIIVAHNFGEVKPGSGRVDICPTIAARVKHCLGIKNPYTVAYDIPFGCPGWVHGLTLADYYIRSGSVKKVMVIGAEILSRVIDPHDVDSMIFADGAGAAIVEATDKDAGIISHVTRSDTEEGVNLIYSDKSYGPDKMDNKTYLKMYGHQVFKYALKYVPRVVKESLDRAGLSITDIKKILIHQANEKMDRSIINSLFKLYRISNVPEEVMPMTIAWLGNSSVATVPTMFDLIQKGRLADHRLESGDNIVFASVGAGMNINSMVYRMP